MHGRAMTDSAVPVAPGPTLSRFEGHCLHRRTLECEALLQLAVLGAEQAQARHGDSTDLSEIVAHLNEAEKHVESARRLAERWRE
jgi:hypothetical protein